MKRTIYIRMEQRGRTVHLKACYSNGRHLPSGYLFRLEASRIRGRIIMIPHRSVQSDIGIKLSHVTKSTIIK